MSGRREASASETWTVEELASSGRLEQSVASKGASLAISSWRRAVYGSGDLSVLRSDADVSMRVEVVLGSDARKDPHERRLDELVFGVEIRGEHATTRYTLKGLGDGRFFVGHCPSCDRSLTFTFKNPPHAPEEVKP